MNNQQLPVSVKRLIHQIENLCGTEHADWSKIFTNAMTNTWQTTMKRQEDGTTFVITGDIPAMWLRDSAAQARPYLFLAKEDPEVAAMIAGVVKKQFQYITIDPYANAFNEFPNKACYHQDLTEMSDWVWERKYEVDSLCYPIQLAYLLYKTSGQSHHLNQDFITGVRKILQVFETEQAHQHSPYRFQRETERKEDTLSRQGRGGKVGPTGMTWSGFRPSDDSCQYGYLVPANMFAVVVLGYIEELFSDILSDKKIVATAQRLRQEIDEGIQRFGKVRNQDKEWIYAYEVDGLGNAVVIDDSNVPSLLSATYLGYCEKDHPLYLATRKTVLSPENPYFYEGEFAQGIGSSHTYKNYVWPIAMTMEGLTTENQSEKKRILNQLASTHAGTYLMHESFDVNCPENYTRPWFSWANMLFCELVMDYFQLHLNM